MAKKKTKAKAVKKEPKGREFVVMSSFDIKDTRFEAGRRVKESELPKGEIKALLASAKIK